MPAYYLSVPDGTEYDRVIAAGKVPEGLPNLLNAALMMGHCIFYDFGNPIRGCSQPIISIPQAGLWLLSLSPVRGSPQSKVSGRS